MKAEINREAEKGLAGHLAALRDISRQMLEDLRASPAAYLAMNLDRIYGHVHSQTVLSEKLRIALEQAATATEKASGSNTATMPEKSFTVRLHSGARVMRAGESETAAAAIHLKQLLGEIRAIQSEIQRLNQLNRVLIAGSLRTVNTLANALANYAPTYGRPAFVGSGAAAGARR